MNTLRLKPLGLTLTGARDQHTPRQEYAFNATGRALLAEFFIISPQVFLGIIPSMIWLTPALIEDLLIYQAFVKDNASYVLIEESSNTNERRLSSFNDTEQAKSLFEAGKNVLVNPHLLTLN